MPVPVPRPVSRDEVGPLSALLARAFHEDPIWAWLQPDPGRRPRKLEKFFAALLRNNLTRGDLVLTTEDLAGVAVWRSPATWRETNKDVVRLTPATLRMGPRAVRRLLRLAREVEPRHPREHHWYLAVLASDPPAQGRGIGSALIRAGLERSGHDGLPAYLETETESNVAFYSRHGFGVKETLVVPGGGPRLWLLWRPEPHA
ncbi:MAG: GNAT family N-acetyltransferase [Actinobacteria bacterium ATB1]|nr:GNAT family N-acetyltransferase [Actinobacteria bacterium ATB1]